MLEDDKDISNYASICTVTRNAIEGDNLSFWRVKWRQRFALLEDRTNRELRRIFKRRAKYLRRGMVLVWNRGRTPRELSVIGVLKELIVGKLLFVLFSQLRGVVLRMELGEVWMSAVENR